MDPLRRTDIGRHSRAGRNFRRSRPGYLVALDVCRGFGVAIFPKRAGGELLFSIFPDVSSLYTSGSRDGWCLVDQRVRAIAPLLRGSSQVLRACFHSVLVAKKSL